MPKFQYNTAVLSFLNSFTERYNKENEQCILRKVSMQVDMRTQYINLIDQAITQLSYMWFFFCLSLQTSVLQIFHDGWQRRLKQGDRRTAGRARPVLAAPAIDALAVEVVTARYNPDQMKVYRVCEILDITSGQRANCPTDTQKYKRTYRRTKNGKSILTSTLPAYNITSKV